MHGSLSVRRFSALASPAAPATTGTRIAATTGTLATTATTTTTPIGTSHAATTMAKATTTRIGIAPAGTAGTSLTSRRTVYVKTSHPASRWEHMTRDRLTVLYLGEVLGGRSYPTSHTPASFSGLRYLLQCKVCGGWVDCCDLK